MLTASEKLSRKDHTNESPHQITAVFLGEQRTTHAFALIRCKSARKECNIVTISFGRNSIPRTRFMGEILKSMLPGRSRL